MTESEYLEEILGYINFVLSLQNKKGDFTIFFKSVN